MQRKVRLLRQPKLKETKKEEVKVSETKKEKGGGVKASEPPEKDETLQHMENFIDPLNPNLDILQLPPDEQKEELTRIEEEKVIALCGRIFGVNIGPKNIV